MRNYFTLIWLIVSLQSFAQAVDYDYDLKFNPKTSTISGLMDARITNPYNQPLSKIVLHLPPLSLQNRTSYLHQELIDFQKADAYFADSNSLGYIQYSTIRNPLIYSISDSSEFLMAHLNAPLRPGDYIDLQLQFKIKLSSSEYNGIGYDGKVFRIIDWLPRLASFDSSGFYLYPVTFQMDQKPMTANYEVDLELPSPYIVASNAKLHGEEANFYHSLSTQTFSRKEWPSGNKKLHFSHTGTNLQFFISREFYVLPLSDKGYIFTTSTDPLAPSVIKTLDQQVSDFFKRELDTCLNDYQLVLLEDKNAEYQSDHLLSLSYPKTAFKFASDLAHARAESLFRYQLKPDGIKDLWLARGVPYYYKYRFINSVYPEEKWLPLSNTFIGKFFALDAFDYSYQNQFLFLYLSRQGLDQPINSPVDSLTRLNYEAVAQAKTFLAFSHLRAYMGDREFARGMRKYIFHSVEAAHPKQLEKSMNFYSNKDLSWFFNDWINSSASYDYRLIKTEHCSTVSTATVDNTGRLSLPYSLTGYKDDKAVLTQWYEGHMGEKSVQMYHQDYDKVVLNAHQSVPEHTQKNNTFYNRQLFPRLEPLRLQFYYSFEDPNKSQLYWTPTISYNAYDELLVGVSLDNSSLIQKKWEYLIGPDYSTGTGKLTGYASLKYNHLPKPNKTFHQISSGIYSRYYHYDEGLSYLRVSPAVNFYFQKPYPRSSLLRQLKLRLVHLKRELPEGFTEPANEVGNSSFTVFNGNYRYQQTNILNPYTLEGDFLLGDQFSRLGLSSDIRWMLPNKKWLIWRAYGGLFLFNRYFSQGISNSYYSMGLSGTKDFLFDLPFFGRSDETGIWSRQFFVSEGGFKNETNVFADEWMLSTNVCLPVYNMLGLYGDLGFADNFNKAYYGAGIRIAPLTDFLEIYFPVFEGKTFSPTSYNYLSRVRFVLDIDQANIINRLRRGYY